MTFMTKAFRQFPAEEIELLKTNPPTEESRTIAIRLGEMMGEYAYPGDMVLQSVSYEAGQNAWPAEIASIMGKLAFEGMQRG